MPGLWTLEYGNQGLSHVNSETASVTSLPVLEGSLSLKIDYIQTVFVAIGIHCNKIQSSPYHANCSRPQATLLVTSLPHTAPIVDLCYAWLFVTQILGCAFNNQEKEFQCF